MKVALITPELHPNWGGVGTYCMELAKSLPREVETHILTTRVDGVSYKSFDSEHRNDNIRLHLLSTRRDNFTYNLSFQYAVRRKFPSLHREYNFDIIHCNHAHMSDLLLSLKNGYPPIVRTIHSTISSQRAGTKGSRTSLDRLESSEKFTLALLPILSIAERYCLRRNQAAIFVSDYIRKDVERIVGKCANIEVVIRNGVDLQTFSPRKKEQARGRITELSEMTNPIVLFSGRLLAMKGIYILARAAVKVLEVSPDVRFVFAGDGDAGGLRQEIARLGLPDDNFIFLGKIEHSSMPDLYAAADACVLPSLIESCPLSLLEAMACGRPVIATAVGDVPHIMQDGVSGFVVPPGNEGGLAGSILKALADNSLSVEISKGARRAVERDYSTEQMAAKTFDVYRHVLGENN